jgi:hypothetical protein
MERGILLVKDAANLFEIYNKLEAPLVGTDEDPNA